MAQAGPTVTTLGQRLYLVRLALGDGIKRAERQDQFAARLRAAAPEGVAGFSPSALSGWENDLAKPSVDQIAVIASVDPLGRGPGWLAWGTPPAAPRNRDEVSDAFAVRPDQMRDPAAVLAERGEAADDEKPAARLRKAR